MKHLNKLLLAVLIVCSFSSQAQNSNNPWALSFGANAVDTKVSAGGGNNFVDSFFSQAFKVSDNWNILPSVSYIGLAKSIGNNFSVGVQGSINKINKWVVYDHSNPGANAQGYAAENPGDLMYYGIDANVRYSFMSLIKSKVIDPSIAIGGGYTWLGDNSFGSVNGGLGLTLWFTENVGLQFTSTYKASQLIGQDRNVVGDIYEPKAPSHFVHTAGLVFQFGGKDTDGDGIYDKEDACPEVAGLKQFKGCPDTDGDGIIDGSDACPTESGLAALNGCPDKDGDGIADKDDACPDAAGKAAFKGCPDTDGDGIADKDDKCPKVAGLKSNGGCPIVDSDKDGVEDKDDACPTVSGPASNKGCPEVTPDTIKQLNDFGKTILFDSGKSSFKSQTFTVLESISAILKEYPNSNFMIEGHTDGDGSASSNQKLSEERASAVKDYLIEKGISSARLSSTGFGETKPIDSNKTVKGKLNNRRVEVSLVK